MQAVRVIENPEVYLLSVPNPKFMGRSTNIYIARKGDECLLVDAGFAGKVALEVVEQALSSLGLGSAPLTLFLTHLHLDHAGLVRELSSRHRVKIVMGRTEYAAMLRIQSFMPSMAQEWEPLLMNGLPLRDVESLSGFGSYSVVIPETLPVTTVEDGDELCVAGCRMRVVDLAGHVPGHMGLLETKTNTLFSGDHLLFDLSPTLQSSYTPFNELDRYLANLKKVCEMQPSRLLHSHGKLRDDYARRAKWLIDHQTKRKLEALQVIKDNPGLSGVEVARLMSWNISEDKWDRINLLLKACMVETAIVGINQLVYDGLVSREEHPGSPYLYKAK